MECCKKDKAIVIVQGDDTNFNGQEFLKLYLRTQIIDLNTAKATFTFQNIKKEFNDISDGVIKISYTAAETANFTLGISFGVLRIYDESNKRATIESFVPFYVKKFVHGDSIATTPFDMTINVEQGGQTILNIDVEAGVSVEVGTTTTLPAGSDATVTNVGTPNHLVLDFGIPQGIQGERGIQGETGNGISSIVKTSSTGLVDTYTIYFTNGSSTTFNVENGNGVASITKTSTSGLIDTYTITYTNGQTSTFSVTNGEDASIIIRRL